MAGDELTQEEARRIAGALDGPFGTVYEADEVEEAVAAARVEEARARAEAEAERKAAHAEREARLWAQVRRDPRNGYSESREPAPPGDEAEDVDPAPLADKLAREDAEAEAAAKRAMEGGE